MIAANRKRWALFIFFFMTGVCMASWVTRTPAIRDQLHASTAQMGWILFGLSSGSMVGLLSANTLIAWFGTSRAVAGGVAVLVFGVAVMGSGVAAGAALLVSVGLFLFGFGMGSSEIAINIEGAEVEATLNRPVLVSLHGCFSAGTLIGALIGITLTDNDFPVHWHLWFIGFVAAPAVWYASRSLLAGTRQCPPTNPANAHPASAQQTQTLWKDTRLLMIGVIIMAMALAEGAANDWLPLLMVDGHRFAPTSGSMVYAGFAAGMTVGRFAGSYCIARLGRGVVVFTSAVSCAIGLALAIFASVPWLAAVSVLFWGMGASLGFPVAISAAGNSGPDASRRVGLVTTAGYFSFLVGPPLLGFIGDHYGLRSALIVVFVLVVIAIFMTPATRDEGKSTSFSH